MSEYEGIRHRRGGAAGAGDNISSELMETTDKIISSIQEAAKPKPGLSAEAKKYKDALTVDPYNLEYMFALGVCYCKDNQWKKAENVLIRGWKRVKEFEQKEMRFSYLHVLLGATLKNHKYQQASAIFQDMEEPERDKLMYFTSMCEVMGFTRHPDKCLKAFNNAIDILDAEYEGNKDKFQQIVEMWAHLIPACDKADILVATRERIALFATNDEEKAKIEVYEKLAKVKSEITEAATAEQTLQINQKVAIVGFAVIGLVIMYLLYKLEQASLAKLSFSK